MRNLDWRPYSPAEAQVAAFFAGLGSGGGDDPIGAIIASHQYLAAQRNRYRQAIIDAIEALEKNSTSAPVLEALKVSLEL